MQYDFTIIGAGIVGLAAGLRIAEQLPDVTIRFIEKENDIALHQTGNNSGVIHSGIYYKPGSLKAKNCREGYKKLIEFCDEHSIKYELCGKLIVATDERELEYLNLLLERGKANGLEGLKKLAGEELKEYEPHVAGIGGIYVPQTGIVDYKEVASKYKELLEFKGAEFVFGEKVKKILKGKNENVIVTNKNEYRSTWVISCAGLQSDKLAATTNKELDFRIIPFRGEYYKIKKEKRALVKNLIYPVPDPAFPFLGVHFTRRITGEVEAGPNAVLSFKREGYRRTSFNLFDAAETFAWRGFRKVALKYWRVGLGEFYRSFSKNAFVKALQKLVPEITHADLERGGAGIRAQACDRDGNLLDDFKIIRQGKIIHVCNAPSPAATSSLSIGKYISDLVLSN